MKTVNSVIDGVYSLLTTPDIGEGKTFAHFYKWSYPDGGEDAYFGVVNTLAVPSDSIQTVDFNVNVYAKDLSHRGIPDLNTLNTMGASVINDLHHINNDFYDIRYDFMQVIRVEELGAHMYNMRFKLLFINN